MLSIPSNAGKLASSFCFRLLWISQWAFLLRSLLNVSVMAHVEWKGKLCLNWLIITSLYLVMIGCYLSMLMAHTIWLLLRPLILTPRPVMRRSLALALTPVAPSSCTTLRPAQENSFYFFSYPMAQNFLILTNIGCWSDDLYFTYRKEKTTALFKVVLFLVWTTPSSLLISIPCMLGHPSFLALDLQGFILLNLIKRAKHIVEFTYELPFPN